MCKSKLSTILSVFIALLTVVTLGAFPYTQASAATYTAYDLTEIERDLSDLDTTKYAPDPNGTPRLVDEMGFMEYAYSLDEQVARSFYGVYFYVFNPAKLDLSERTGAHSVNMAVEYTESGNPTSYAALSLTLLDKTDDNLFYKFKLANGRGAYDRAKEYAAKHGGERRYDVAELQLWENGEASPVVYEVGRSFYCNGFSHGCGEDKEAESTLNCSSGKLTTLPLEAHPTTYVTPNRNEKAEDLYDALHSVYFAIPDNYIEKYGEITAIHAQWLEALLSAGLVTGNQEAYNAILPFLGKTLANGYDESLKYYYYTNLVSVGPDNDKAWNYKRGYNTRKDYPYNHFSNAGWTEPQIDTLHLMFDAGDKLNSADEYRVSSSDLKKRLDLLTKQYGGELVEGKYDRSLFAEVANEVTDLTIPAKQMSKEEFENQRVARNWWQAFYRSESWQERNPSTTFDKIQTVYTVSDTDLNATDEELSARLFIAKADCDDFRSFYEAHRLGETVYILRYRVTDYYAAEATLMTPQKDVLGREYPHTVDTNAYFFQEEIDINFDFIDVSFFDGSELQIIAAVSSPVDNIQGTQPPANPKEDKPKVDWVGFLKIAVPTILAVAIIICVFGLVSKVVKNKQEVRIVQGGAPRSGRSNVTQKRSPPKKRTPQKKKTKKTAKQKGKGGKK